MIIDILKKIPLVRRLYSNFKLFPFKFKHQRLIKDIRRRNTLNVVFYAMNLPMWRYQNLYVELNKKTNFNVYIVLSPCITYSKEQQIEDIKTLEKYFQENNISYIDYDFTTSEIFDVKKNINPDMVFYPQPYSGLLNELHDSRNFYDKLICYYPYAFWTANGEWSYNSQFHNVAWRLFYSTNLHLKDAKKWADNRGRNVSVVGYPNSDIFCSLEKNLFQTNIWKDCNKYKKRIIWAPHFSIGNEKRLINFGNFLWMADFMLEIAEKYKDSIQFAFRPHPRLLTELCDEKYWGKEKTYEYYNKWDKMENAQLSINSNFAELFISSDAMIHDCGSFTVEYHYTNNPVMFIVKDENVHRKSLNNFGKLAFDAHYKGASQSDIIQFIEDVVLKGIDPMKENRKIFFDKYLSQKDGISVAEKTADEIIKLLKL